MKPKVLIIAAANIATCPRAMAMAEILCDDYDISVMGIDTDDKHPMPQVRLKSDSNPILIPTFSYPAYKKRGWLREMLLWWHVLTHQWNKLAFIHNRLSIITHLQHHRYDLIICHDILLLPVLFAGLEKIQSTKRTKVIFDAQEFYPLQNISSLRWRWLFKAFNECLCKTYMPKADIVFSASPSFCAMYKEHFTISPTLLMLLPRFYDIAPKPINKNKIRIIYHGALNQNRDIDKVIEICKFLDHRFCVDFIFTGGNKAFRRYITQKLNKLQATYHNIAILPPVSLESIVPFGNTYDIGLLYIPPHNTNLLATFPNKIFEYTQSRLAIAMPPIAQIQSVISKHCIVAQDFSIRALANAINALSIDRLDSLKHSADTAAKTLHRDVSKTQVLDTIKTLLR